MLILGIESTCDETAAAVVRDGADVLSSTVATQFELHEKFRGVVPEIASRAHIQNVVPVITEACEAAGVRLADVDAVAVAHCPGLIGSLLIGVTAAKTLAWSLGKPLVAVDHVQAHLYSVMLREGARGAAPLVDRASLARRPSPVAPSIGLVVSGGHTALYLVRDWLDVRLIGTTIDDAVGEAYDKVAALLGLPFPGGPVIDRLAAAGDPKAYDFPRSMLGRDSLDFSFSGLKTAVRYQVFGYQGRSRSAVDLGERETADVAASFQAACVDVLIEKVSRAVRRFGARSVIIGGGVSANSGLRAAAGMKIGSVPVSIGTASSSAASAGRAQKTGSVPVSFPEMKYCTDNAAMIAGLGHVHLAAGRVAGLDLDAVTHSSIEPIDEATPTP